MDCESVNQEGVIAAFTTNIDDLSDTYLSLIFTYVNPYDDYTNVLRVNRRWNRVVW